jgi:pyruvate formate lyase activating enzyme
MMRKKIDRRDFLAQCGRCALLCAGMNSLGWMTGPASSGAEGLTKGFLGQKLSPYFTPLDGQVVRCELCPRRCEVAKDERGYCRVRKNIDGRYYSLVYGNPCAVNVDPVEKKPFFHLLPSSLSFSIATAGCNLNCKFCQNWEISQARPDDTFNYELDPSKVVEEAVRYKCLSIASTYVEPTIFIEYMLDIGRLAKERKLLKVMHSNGFINEAPLKDLCRYLDGACIDLKGFTDEYYREITEGGLGPVLETLKRLHQWGVHTEIVNLMVPGKNDDLEQVRAMCRWIKEELSPDVPLHFTRFYPLYKLKSLPPTPIETLDQAWKTALDVGLRFVYTGNMPGHPGEHTICPKCKTRLIERTGYRVQVLQMKDGSCAKCGQPIPGIWKPPEA